MSQVAIFWFQSHFSTLLLWNGQISSLLFIISTQFADTSKILPTLNISFLDCRTHTWLEAPSLRLAHTDSIFEGNMYLTGCCENPDSMNCIEVFNTDTKTWKPVPPEKRIFKPTNMEGKIYRDLIGLPGKRGLAVKPKESISELVGLDTGLDRFSVCIIENITYFYKCNGEFAWSGTQVVGVGVVRGLEGLPKFARYSSVKLADYGGKMVVLWDKYVPASGYKEKMIWCAVISLERRSNEEIWGKVEWFDAVLTVPKSYKFVYAITATV